MACVRILNHRISSLSTGTCIAVSFPIDPGSASREPLVLNS